MKISCICLTYNRFPTRNYLVEEAVHSFLQQDYPDKELLLINDCPQQKLVFNHPEVVVVNLPKRCRTLGEKYNLAVALSSGDYIAPWDDDDISCPKRLSFAAEVLKKTDSHYYKAFGQWCLARQGLTRSTNFVGHNSSVYSRKGFAKAGGYPITSWGPDTEMDRRLKVLGAHVSGEVGVYDWQYIYRWGVSDLHLSALGGQDPEKAWILAGQKPVVAGEFVLEPKWLYPYSQLTLAAAKSGLAVLPTPDLEFWK